MAEAEPRTIAAFRAAAQADELGSALGAALGARGMVTTRPISIEQAAELSVEFGGRLVSVLVGVPRTDPGERFVSVGRLTFASGRLIGQRDEVERQRLADLLDEVLREDLGVLDPEWMTATAWKERAR